MTNRQRANRLIEEFDAEGISVGWFGQAFGPKGDLVKIFIPRRDEEIAEQRARIARGEIPLNQL